MKTFAKTISVVIVFLFVLSCASCNWRGKAAAKSITALDVGDTFTVYSALTGDRICQVNSVQVTDNVTELGIAPSELKDYGYGISYKNEEGDFVSITWPDYVDMTTGQLAEHLRFVLVEVTMINDNALSKPIPENDDGVRDDSWYAFCIDELTIRDLSILGNDSFHGFHALWYAGTGDYDAAAADTNGDNYYILRPGESLTYQIGFIVASGDDDFSQFYLTDGSGSYYAKGANYVNLGLSDMN
jgi:hypothetical protein